MTELQFLLAVVDDMKRRGWKAALENDDFGRAYASARIKDDFVLTAHVAPGGRGLSGLVSIAESASGNTVTETLGTLDGVAAPSVTQLIDRAVGSFRQRP